MSKALCHVVLLLLLCDLTLSARIICKVPQGGEASLPDSDTATDEQMDSSLGAEGEQDSGLGVREPSSTDEDFGAPFPAVHMTVPPDNSLSKDEDSRETIKNKQPRRQKTFFRNPNYISANKKFDKQAENMYILDLPRPHPGALPGSTNGCEEFEA